MAIISITNLTQGDEWDNFEAWFKVENDEEHSGEWTTGYKMTTAEGISLSMYTKVADKRTWNFPITFNSVDDYAITGELDGFSVVKYVNKIELVWDGETDPVVPTNLTLTYDDSTHVIEPFELPYPNWYDEDGRIYKDLLIKNFNAIEDKINEILSVDLDTINIPDVSNISYPDVDIDDEDKDNYILNFRSFLNICNLINFPLKVITDGNVKVKQVEYIGSDYAYHKILANNSTMPATSTYPYIYLDTFNRVISRTNDIEDITSDSDNVLLAVLYDNFLVTNCMKIPGNVNFQKILSDQARSTYEFHCDRADRGYGALSGGHTYNGQTVFGWNAATKYRDSGRDIYGTPTLYFLTGQTRGEAMEEHDDV